MTEDTLSDRIARFRAAMAAQSNPHLWTACKILADCQNRIDELEKELVEVERSQEYWQDKAGSRAEMLNTMEKRAEELEQGEQFKLRENAEAQLESAKRLLKYANPDAEEKLREQLESADALLRRLTGFVGPEWPKLRSDMADYFAKKEKGNG